MVNILITFDIIVEMSSENGVMHLDYKSERNFTKPSLQCK